MDDAQIQTSEKATSRLAEGPKIEATEELLRLLRAINDKLDAGAKLPEGSAKLSGGTTVPAAEESATEEKINEKDCWYMNTLPSVDFASKLSYSWL